MPAPAPLGDAQSRTVAQCIASLRDTAGPLLPILHAIQDALGWIPPAALPAIATALSLSRAEVHGVASFYPHFRLQAPGQHVLQVCRAESCQARGGRGLEQLAAQLLGTDWHGTSADGCVTLEPVYCLGQCAASPAIRLDDEIHARVTPEALTAQIEACRQPAQQEDAA